MKKRNTFLFNTILWYIVSAMWTVTLIFRLTADEPNYALTVITAFTLLASLACAIINHHNYLKEKNSAQDTDTENK